MSKFNIPTLSDAQYKNLDEKSSAVFGEPIKENTTVTLDYIEDSDLADAEKGRTIGSDPTPRYFVYVSGKSDKNSPRISLSGLAKPTFRDEVVQAIVAAKWNDKCVNIRANNYANVVEHAREYNRQVARHTDAKGVCKIKCVHAGSIKELQTRKGTIKDVTWRIWEWITPEHDIEEKKG